MKYIEYTGGNIVELTPIVLIILLLFVSYLIGSVPSALIVGKLIYKKDIRTEGSGNLGGTNTFRVLGKKAGFIVSTADVLKGTLAASLPLLLGIDLNPLIAGVPAVYGHCYPIFARFKGGKAIATSGGVLLLAHPILFVVMFICFFITLKMTKIVSLSSILSTVIFTIIIIFVGDVFAIIAAGLLLLLIIYRHRANMTRIMNKTEPKIKWM